VFASRPCATSVWKNPLRWLLSRTCPGPAETHLRSRSADRMNKTAVRCLGFHDQGRKLIGLSGKTTSRWSTELVFRGGPGVSPRTNEEHQLPARFPALAEPFSSSFAEAVESAPTRKRRKKGATTSLHRRHSDGECYGRAGSSAKELGQPIINADYHRRLPANHPVPVEGGAGRRACWLQFNRANAPRVNRTVTQARAHPLSGAGPSACAFGWWTSCTTAPCGKLQGDRRPPWGFMTSCGESFHP